MIQVVVRGENVFHTIMGEGASTCIMSMSCCKALGSPSLTQSLMMLKSFDGRGFKPYEMINSLPVELVSKTISVEVKVIDEELDYNLLLGHT